MRSLSTSRRHSLATRTQSRSLAFATRTARWPVNSATASRWSRLMVSASAPISDATRRTRAMPFLRTARSTFSGSTPSSRQRCAPRLRSASSSGFLSSVASIASAASASPQSSHTTASNSAVPALRMARQRRSPSTMRYTPPSCTSSGGVMGSPGCAGFRAKLAASASRSPKSRRGLPSLG